MSVAIRLLLTCTLLVASPAVAQTNEAPVVNGCSPHSGSVNSVTELKGFRLGLDELESAKAFFIGPHPLLLNWQKSRCRHTYRPSDSRKIRGCSCGPGPIA